MTPKKKEEPVADEMDLPVLDGTEDAQSDYIISEEDTQTTPCIYDEDWTAFVMQQFRSDELVNGNPKTAALRRVAQKVLGPIIDSDVSVISQPSADNGKMCIVKASIVIYFPDGGERRFSDCSDAHRYNTEAQYSQHLTAVAATRAQGRALRNALGLTNLLAAEELAPTTEQIEIETEWEPETIVDQQVTTMDVLCQRLDIDVLTFINSGRKYYNSYREIPKGVAALMIRKLNTYQQNPTIIPTNLKGYNASWKGD